MTGEIVFDPLVPWWAIGAVTAVAAAMVVLALWRGLSGWWLRALAAVVLVAALAGPALEEEERLTQPDIVLLLVDETSSQGISERTAQTEAAAGALRERLAARPETELREITVADGPDNTGTRMMTALSEALAELPRERIAGALMVTDGQIHDLDRAPEMPAPLHGLITGNEDDWGRRLEVETAPAYAILDEPVEIALRVEDQGAVPGDVTGQAELTMSLNGETLRRLEVPTGETITLPVTLERGGTNVVTLDVAEEDGELTARNNSAVIEINGVRDRLSVLLVSGEPHAGQRTWRNLLRSDSAVDLVHFTILRPPGKQDGAPVDELALIAFPTRELFVDKIDEFDLIILDRYQRRGILPSAYFANIRDYVTGGGAVLVAAGPELAGADSVARSPLGEIFPGWPTAQVREQGFTPRISALGERHPVTAGLDDLHGAADEDGPGWGRWFRQIELEEQGGQVVMTGVDDKPLLMLDRVGRGRLALLASDHAWLWHRGYEGGGPQLDLLRRLAHWTMEEPELEEEALTATADGRTVTVTRRTLEDSAAPVTVEAPDGETIELALEETAPGRFTAEWEADDIGLYRLDDGAREAVVAVGPAAPREFEQTIATGDGLARHVEATRGGIFRVEDGLPDIRDVREGRAAAGRGWLGLTPREAYLTTDLSRGPLLPAWVWLLLAATLALAAWLREGRR